MSAVYRDLLTKLGYSISDKNLVTLALTHRSHGPDNFERLEFLGDSVLGFTVSYFLYDRFPQLSEGGLTRLRADLVRKETLARLARKIDLGSYLHLGSGELKSGGHDRDSILADALEALIGAVFIDGGIDAVRKAIYHIYDNLFEDVDPTAIQKDAKTQLQEYLQKRGLPIPVYTIDQVAGKAHAQTFQILVTVTELAQPVRGEGSSRRAAEQDAAARVLQELIDSS